LNAPTTKAISSGIDLIMISANTGDVSITSGTFGTTYGISSSSNRLISASVGGSTA
jgi:hypothetical protein